MYSGASSANRGSNSHWISAGRLSGRLRRASSTWSVARPAAASANASAIATQLSSVTSAGLGSAASRTSSTPNRSAPKLTGRHARQLS